MPKKKRLTPTDIARSHASSWDRDDLLEMAAIIDGLLAAFDAIGEPPIAKSQQQGKHGGGGYVEQKTISGCGPYRYLRYWHQGKRKSIYLGKAVDEERSHSNATATV